MSISTPSQPQLVVLKRGDELISRLNDYASRSNLNSAWLGGLGGADAATLGFYDLEKRDYIWREYNEPLEIVSLTGNLTIVDDQPFWHIHGVFSGADFQAISGHVKQLRVGLTGELLITPLSVELTRQYDQATGLKLINKKTG